MECVIDNSAISWLSKINYLYLLKEVYDKIYASPGVYKQCEQNYYFEELKSNILTLITVDNWKRFYKLSRRWRRKLNLDDIVDVEAFVAHYHYNYGKELLFANKDALYKFGKYCKVRDIYQLYKLAEDKHIFSREDSISYIEILREKGYDTIFIRNELKKLNSFFRG